MMPTQGQSISNGPTPTAKWTPAFPDNLHLLSPCLQNPKAGLARIFKIILKRKKACTRQWSLRGLRTVTSAHVPRWRKHLCAYEVERSINANYAGLQQSFQYHLLEQKMPRQILEEKVVEQKCLSNSKVSVSPSPTLSS